LISFAGATWGVAYDIASKYGYDMVGGGGLTVSAVVSFNKMFFNNFM